MVALYHEGYLTYGTECPFGHAMNKDNFVLLKEYLVT